jgi:hypothetical protein
MAVDVAADLSAWLVHDFRPYLIRSPARGGLGWCRGDCIRVAKMALALFRSFKIPAEELSVYALACNAPVASVLRERGVWLDDLAPGDLKGVIGPRLVRMGRSLRPGDNPYFHASGGWRGHLIVLANARLLLDLTLDRFEEHPKDNIHGVPLVLPLGAASVQTFKGGRSLCVDLPGGGIISYRVDPENQAFRRTDAWRTWGPTHDEVVRQARMRFLASR